MLDFEILISKYLVYISGSSKLAGWNWFRKYTIQTSTGDLLYYRVRCSQSLLVTPWQYPTFLKNHHNKSLLLFPLFATLSLYSKGLLPHPESAASPRVYYYLYLLGFATTLWANTREKSVKDRRAACEVRKPES